MTHTYALLPVPKAGWDAIADALDNAGLTQSMIVRGADGQPTVALQMTGIALIPVGDSDVFTTFNQLTELADKIARDAFADGFSAGRTGTHNRDAAFDRYEPSDEIADLWDAL